MNQLCYNKIDLILIGVDEMIKNRKKISRWFASILVVFLLTACGSTNLTSDKDEPVEEPTEEVEVTDEEQTDEVEVTDENEDEESESDSSEHIPLTIYQADDQLMALDKIDAELVLNTNDPERLAFEELLSGEKEGYENIYLLPNGARINSLLLNQDDVVEVDLSSEYVTNMNAGAGGEVFFLQGLTNTLTEYYGVNDLKLTIDGEIYESGHIILKEDELLSFDDSNVND